MICNTKIKTLNNNTQTIIIGNYLKPDFSKLSLTFLI